MDVGLFVYCILNDVGVWMGYDMNAAHDEYEDQVFAMRNVRVGCRRGRTLAWRVFAALFVIYFI